MAKFQNFEEVYSALYIDFDNIYTRLAEQDPALARTFATCPQRWMRWIEGHALRMMYGDGVRRRVLKKCCYLNPHRYHEFRPYFIRAAFQVVDCPPLTNYGKTSADIHLVMDCMDALAHVTRFDEIIILSGDADFTPLLLRIQEHARRTLVLSVGYTSPAYVAACSWRIREDWFIAQALEEIRDDDPGEDANRHLDRDTRAAESRGDTRAGERVSAEASRGIAMHLPAGKRMRLIESIKQVVAESDVPVPLPSVAQVLQHEQEIPSDWFGAGSLRDFVLALDISPLEFFPVGPGYVYDPARHEPAHEASARDDFRARMPLLHAFAVKVNQLTDIPLLHPSLYAQLMVLLAVEIRGHGFSRAETAQHVEERCREEGLPISMPQIAFVLEAIPRGGLSLSNPEDVSGITDKALTDALFLRAGELCRLSQMALTEEEVYMLDCWLRSTGKILD